MKKETLVFSIVNAAYKEKIREEEIAELLKRKFFPEAKFVEHLEVFFTEVPVSCINKFLKRYEISLQQLQDYYETFIKPRLCNKELEELFRG
jgi:hypothetical protein